MKSFGPILALCALHPAAAFLAPATTSFKSISLGSSKASDAVSSFYSTSKPGDSPKVNPAVPDDYTVRVCVCPKIVVPVPSLLICSRVPHL